MPKDESGNGGGFVFDSRSVPNPGREDRFKPLTGKDAPVIEYLNQQEGVHEFLGHTASLVEASINNYQKRGFSQSHDFLRLHWWKAPLGLFRRAVGQAFVRQEGHSGFCTASRVGEDYQVRAMILAAGLGTRLRPLTENRPKALVEVGGRTLLEITLARLRSFGIIDVIVNTTISLDMVQEYLERNKNFGMNVAISHEEILLDTGGGLKKASVLFSRPVGQSRRTISFAQRGCDQHH